MPGRIIHQAAETAKDVVALGAVGGFLYAPIWEDMSPFLSTLSIVAGLVVSFIRIRAHVRKRECSEDHKSRESG